MRSGSRASLRPPRVSRPSFRAPLVSLARPPPGTSVKPPRSHRRSVHSVRSVHRRSVTFAAESVSSSAPSTDKDQLSASTGARESIVPEPDDPDTEATAGHTPRPSKRASLLRSSFNASRRTLNRLRRSRSSVPVTVTEEFTVERIVHPDEHEHTASSDWGTHVESQSATTPPDSPSTLRAKRKAFAKLARAAFGAPSRDSSVSTRTRKHRASSHAETQSHSATAPAFEAVPEPERETPPENGQTVPIEVFVHEPSPPPAPPPELPFTPFAEPATPAVTETTVAPATTATDTSAPTPAVAHDSLPSTAVSSPNPKKPKFRAKLNKLWTEQARAARDTLRSASRIHLQSRSRSRSSLPTAYAPPSADSALFPLPPESPVSPISPAASRSQSRLRRIASRLSSVRNKSKSTVHLERIPEIVTADGHVLVNPAALADSPLSQHSDLPPESSAPASRRQSWWTPSHYSHSHSRFPSAVTLPDEQAYSRPVSEALFPSTPYPHARKPKLSIVTDPVSKAGEPQPKTPKSILKSPSRAFFRRRSSPLPHAPQESKPAAQNFFARAFARPPQPHLDLEPQLEAQFHFDSVLHSTELFPLPTPSTSTSPAPAYRPPSPPPAPSASAHAHEFFFPSEKPQQLAVADAEGNAVWYIEKDASSLAAPIPIPFIPPHNKDPHALPHDPDDLDDTMGAKDFHDDGIDYAEDEDDMPPGFQWFADRPPKPDPPPPRTTSTVYQPLPSVIDENERMLKALNQAPSVLYQRYHEFGQLGVFGWTSEFAELIDALKTLGFDGNMFVSTRQAALDACSRILSLRIEIKMQIITIYLTNQISRLRRFLDADKQWTDYPHVDFPIDPYAAESG